MMPLLAMTEEVIQKVDPGAKKFNRCSIYRIFSCDLQESRR